MRPHFEFFYSELFPKLKDKTQFRPEAVELIQAALERGYQVGIATNPAFPLTAILQRLNGLGWTLINTPSALSLRTKPSTLQNPTPHFLQNSSR